MRWLTLAYLLAVVTAAAGTQSVAAGPVVLVVVLDGMRPDHLGCYGALTHASPVIDALGASGIVFTRAYATSAVADASIAGILTSQLPSADTPERADVATALAAAGAITAAVTTAPEDEPRGRRRGFRDFATVPSVDDTASMAAGFTGADRAAFPLLLWMQTHRRELLSQRVFLWWRQDVTRLGRLPAAEFVRRYLPAPLDLGLEGLQRRLLAGDVRFAPTELRQLAAVHDAAIAQSDAALARVLDQLRAPEIARRLWVIVTASFGEALGEHATVGHGTTLYDEVIHVPLIVLPPLGGARGRRYPEPVGLIDLAPTILGLAGVAAVPEFRGRDLGPIIHGGTMRPVDIVAEVPARTADRVHTRAVIDGRWHKRIERADGRTEVFDLRSDPGELQPLAP